MATIKSKEVEEIKATVDADLTAAFQEQIVHEFQNEKLYLSMAIWLAKNGYNQTAEFFSTHALEERKHGMDFINAMLKQSFDVETPEPPAVEKEFKDLKDLLEKALKRELKTSKLIAELHALALKENSILMQISGAYIKEQVEEEQLFQSILNLYDVCEGSKFNFESSISTIKIKNKFITGNL